jgi:hypothetical protein
MGRTGKSATPGVAEVPQYGNFPEPVLAPDKELVCKLPKNTLWPLTCSADMEGDGGLYDRSGGFGGSGGTLPATFGDADAACRGTLSHTVPTKWTHPAA